MPVMDLGTFDISSSNDPRKEYLQAPSAPLAPNVPEPAQLSMKATPAPPEHTTPQSEQPKPKATSWEGATQIYGDFHKEQLEAPPSAPQLPKPPQKGLNDLQGQIQGWGALAIALGALASFRTRQPMTTAMNAAAAAMTSMAQNNQQAFEQQYKQWQDNTKIAIEMTKLEQNSYQLAMENRNQEAQLRMKTISMAYQDPVMAQRIAEGYAEFPNDPVKALQGAADLGKKREADANALKGSTESVVKGVALNTALKEMMQDPTFTSATPAKRSEMIMQKIAESGTGAARWLLTGQFDEETLAGMAKLVEIGKQPFPTNSQISRYPNMKQLAKKVLEDDPNIDPQDYPLVMDARKKLQGKDGDVIRSFTVLLHHLAFLDQLATNLQAAGISATDSPAANRIIASVAKQFGITEVTDFNAVKQFVADESVKAILGASVGGVTDRDEANKIFDIGNTTNQMLKTTKDVRTLAQGQLTGVMSKYRYFLKKGLLQPDDIVPEETLTELGVHVDSPQDLVKPRGQDVFDQLDGGDAVKTLKLEGTNLNVPNPKVEQTSVKEIPEAEAKKAAPPGATRMVHMKDGSWSYEVNGKWVPSGQ